MNINAPDSRADLRVMPAGGFAVPVKRRSLTLGYPAIDARLEAHAPAAALHEFFSEKTGDLASASAFALLTAHRNRGAGPIVWVRQAFAGICLYAPGLNDLGVDPNLVLHVDAPDAMAALRAGGEALKCSAVGAVIVELRHDPRALDLTATRRLSLAAQHAGLPAILLRIDAELEPSAAHTRWQVASAPSIALEANAPGLPAFDVALLRLRGGVAGFEARLEWDREHGKFRQAPVSGGIPAAAAG